MYDYFMNKKQLRQKILQMLILGYEDENPSNQFFELISQGLGGIIFFAENLKSRSDFKLLVKKIKKASPIPLFLSIDQEGGLVERTIFLDKKNEYLTPKSLSRLDNEDDLYLHYDLLSKDLRDLGLNYNFAPVLDVNSNPFNPVINVRAFGDNPQVVNRCSQIALKAFKANHIISCAKHFAGHGDTKIDSHINMPQVSMEYEKFYENHLICFEEAIKNDIESIMMSHIHFEFFNEIKTPSSLSKNAIEIFLKEIWGFKGLVVTDDMVMGGVAKNYGLVESIILAIQSGIDVMIFKNITSELLMAIDEVVDIAIEDEMLKSKINIAYEKILNFKKEKLKDFALSPVNLLENQKQIDLLAEKTVLVNKSGNFLPLDKNKKITVLAFNNKEIYNLSANIHSLSYFLEGYSVEEYNYPLDPTEADIKKYSQIINNTDILIFLSYNAHIYGGQVKLFESFDVPKILVSCALDYDINLFANADSIISLCCAKEPSLKALSKILISN